MDKAFSHKCYLLKGVIVGHKGGYRFVGEWGDIECWFCPMCGIELVDEERRVREQLDWEERNTKRKYIKQEEYEEFGED